MIGKLGSILNTDVGAIVKGARDVLNTDVGAVAKGAGKVLNADVGAMAKGAGKALNADVGDIVKGAGRVLKTDLGDLLRAPAKPTDGVEAAAEPANTATATAAPASASSPAAAPPAAAAGAKITEESVSRNKRGMPSGSDLAVLLPAQAGMFSRPTNSPTGSIATDPVMATYACGDETIVMRITLGWDADEAKEKLMEVQSYTAEGRRMAPDGSWILGVAEGGVVFAWTRDCYFFLALSPRGTSSLARFLAGFPY